MSGNPDRIVEVRALLEGRGYRIDSAADKAGGDLGGIRLERYWCAAPFSASCAA